jgi:formamidopyrimidine-DNA glycosylase
MPELPEVETIARALQNGGREGLPIPGQTIIAVHLLWARTVAYPEPGIFERQILGQTVRHVSRRAKFIQVNLDQDMLLIHLRMSGDIRVEPATNSEGFPEKFQPHDRLVLDFAGNPPFGLRMAFNDPRKFGRVWLTSNPQEILGNLGPEPLADEFTAEILYQQLHSVNRMIKPLLLDQAFLAGMGNIYTDEALHLAGIHPLRSSASIQLDEAALLWSAIRSVLGEGIRRNGASIDWVYRGGDFQNTFQVYQRTGEPCLRCGTTITRIVIGQRGTHFCPTCQPQTKSNLPSPEG